jgi:phosphate transport system substrate-binding protein
MILMASLWGWNSHASTPPPIYQKIDGLNGNLFAVGSDSWSEEFSAVYPTVNVQVQGSGSSTAVPALTQGTAQFGTMSRKMQPSEIADFEKEYGYEPTGLVVAFDALGVFVHQDNPIEGLNFIQLDAIFSATHFCGGQNKIERWKDFGITQPWGKLKIQKFGRNPVSGTHGAFKSQVLCGGDFTNRVNEMLGATAVIQAVASSVTSIGYSGVASKVAGAKMVPIDDFGTDYQLPTRDNILNGTYPLSRKLYLYVNKPPNRDLPKEQREFIRFIYSQQGQAGVKREGYIRVASELAKQELAKVGLK